MKAGPRSCRELFIVFNNLSLQGFGGVMVVTQRELVERRGWMSASTFAEEWALAQTMPGPNVVNLALTIGARYFGWRGALSALAGMLVLPTLIVLFLAALLESTTHLELARNLFRGMGVAAVGVLAGGCLKMFISLHGHPLGRVGAVVVMLITFLAIVVFHLPLPLVLLCIGIPSCVFTFHFLKRDHVDPA